VVVVEVAVAKASKYAMRESGDSVEVVERPRGGLSVVMVDGQRSGRSAKAISNVAVRKAISLLAEGVRDGAVARAAHDYLRTERGGQVSAELTLISVDLETKTIVVTRNSQCPVLVAEMAGDPDEGVYTWRALDAPAEVVGVHSRSRPVIAEWPLTPAQMIVAFTDGVLHAGERRGSPLDVHAVLGAADRQAGWAGARPGRRPARRGVGRRRWPARRRYDGRRRAGVGATRRLRAGGAPHDGNIPRGVACSRHKGFHAPADA